MRRNHDRRILRPLAAVAALLAVCSVAPAQNAAKTASSDTDEYAPRYEIGAFGGVQYWSVNTSGKSLANKLIPGGVAGMRFTYDFARHWGLEATYSFYAVNNLRLYTAQPYPVTSISFGARNAQVMAGPVFYFNPRDRKFRVFLTVGPEYVTYWVTKTAKGFASSPAYAPYDAQYIGGKDNAALFYGGGFKINFNHRIGMRADLKGVYTKNPNFNLPSYTTTVGQVFIPTKQTINELQATLGLEIRFGERPIPAPPAPPPPPPAPVIRDMSVSLSADQSDVCPGTPVRVTLTSNAGAGAAYQWTVNGAAASGDSTFTWDTTGKSAGSYTIAATVRNAGFHDGTGSTTVNVREYRAPSGSVAANPSTITVGGTSLLTPNFTGQCGGAIKPATCTAAEGSISGDTFNSNGVAFDPNNAAAQSKSVLITCTTSDEKGGTGSATTTVTVTKAANPQANRLPDILFGSGSSRVNNAGKRVLLEQLKAYLDRDPTGKVVFVGHFVDKEPKPRRGNTLDEQRALNAAAIISAGQGICLGFAPSQILIGYTGTNQNGVDFQPFFDAGTKERAGSVVKESDPDAKYRRVEVYFVPTGAQMPATATDLKDAASLGVSSLGCPK
jgi:Outer membrane protein beta-barrel domain